MVISEVKDYYEEHFEPECKYKDKCTGKNIIKCNRCKHNKNRNYFEPIIIKIGIILNQYVLHQNHGNQ